MHEESQDIARTQINLSKKVRTNLFPLIVGLMDELAGLRDCFKLFDFTRHHLRDGVHP